MAPLFAAASLLPILSPNPAAAGRLAHGLSSRPTRPEFTLSLRRAPAAAGRGVEGGIPDEWGERSPPASERAVAEPADKGRGCSSSFFLLQPPLPLHLPLLLPPSPPLISMGDPAGRGGSSPFAPPPTPPPPRRIRPWERPSKPDPPIDEDEWGRDADVGNSRPVLADEWGKPGSPEPEPPATADPPSPGIDDEWQPAPAGSEPQEDEAAERREDLKRCLVDTVYGSELGFRASSEVRGEVVELVTQLEAANPTPAPVEAPDLLDGNWILLYTAYSELLPILAAGTTPFVKVRASPAD
ncbi:hypothetical protein EJB05_23174, partial [Eragrostis curvula]